MFAQAILELSKLSITKARMKVLTDILERDIPVTISLLLQTNPGYNRITMYRILRVFVKKEILQIIPSEDNKIIYKINESLLNTVKRRKHCQTHFICNNCKSSICLETASATKIKIPTGYKTKSIEIVINGKCDKCT